MRVLVLSGTGDGRALVAALRASGVEVIESLAGRTALARAGAEPGTRVGGFGGVDGLTAWLRAHQVDAVINATHPFAAQMSEHAAAACRLTGVPLLRWQRPSWHTRPDAAAWLWVPGHEAAVRAASTMGRVLLTVGRQELDAYRALPDVVARVTEPSPGWVAPSGWHVLVARGPFALDDEIVLLREQNISTVVSKDAGGQATQAKLDAAARLGVRVVMIERPSGPGGVPVVADLAAASAWLDGLAG